MSKAIATIVALCLLCGWIEYGALACAASKPIQRQQVPAKLARSGRMIYRDGRCFLITLHRENAFPARLNLFQRVTCRFVPSAGAEKVWNNEASLYFQHPTLTDATFAFRAEGLGSGQILITIDDDELEPIFVDPITFDPCAAPMPVGPKPRP
jgi:hypothetical protein